MTVQEILLDSEKQCGAVPVCLKMVKRFRSYFIVLEIYGKTYNVFSAQDSERGAFSGGILKNLGLSAEYSCSNGCNTYIFSIKRKQTSPFLSLGIAVIMAAIVSLLGGFLPDGARNTLHNNILIPLNDAFLNILGCIAGPTIFLSVVWGIYGIGDTATLKKIGKKVCLSNIGTVFLAVVIIGVLVFPLFDLRFAGDDGGVSSMWALFTMLLGIIPENLFSPFVDGNTLQIIALAVATGIAMLFLGQETDFVAKVVEQINNIVMFLIAAFSKLVPYFIFIVLLKISWSGMLYTLASIGKLVILFLGGALLFQIMLLGYTALRNKIKPSHLVKKGLPTLLVALTTASSAAAFGTNLGACREEFGIDDKLCSFGVPLGIVMNKPCSALNLMLDALFFAELYSLDISVSWLIIMLASSVILAVATPPIPGGGMATYAVLFAQLGIPQEALAIALVCETVFDFVKTGFNQFDIQMVLLNLAGKLGLVDWEKLLSD